MIRYIIQVFCKSVCFYKYGAFEHFMEFVHYKCFIIIIIIVIIIIIIVIIIIIINY